VPARLIMFKYITICAEKVDSPNNALHCHPTKTVKALKEAVTTTSEHHSLDLSFLHLPPDS